MHPKSHHLAGAGKTKGGVPEAGRERHPRGRLPVRRAYTVEQATKLLEGKLSDILVSTANVFEEDRWRKQILAVLAYGPGHTVSLAIALEAIDPAIRGDTIIVWVLVTDDFIDCDDPATEAAVGSLAAHRLRPRCGKFSRRRRSRYSRFC